MRVAVVGAGVFGAAAALHLTRAGHEVVLVDQGQVAGATTGLAAGLVSLGVEDPLERRLVLASMRGLEGLAKERDEPSPLERPGSFVLARTTQEAEHLEALAEDLARLDEPHESLSPSDWGARMDERGLPARTDDLVRVLSIPGDAWALSTETTQLMIQAARDAGLELRQNAAVDSIHWAPSRKATGLVLADGERLEADRVVLAMGAWTAPLLAREGFRLPALAFTTHAAILSLEAPVDAPIVHDHAGHYYFRPESASHLLVGNGTDTTPVDPSTVHTSPDTGFFTSVAARITKRFPGLRSARLKTAWRGVLTATPDRAALVGPHPEADGLWVMTGDNGYGFMRAWALGGVLAAAMDPEVGLPEGVPPRALEHVAPARFWPDPPARFPVKEGFELAGGAHDPE